jgi:hypothetical protein
MPLCNTGNLQKILRHHDYFQAEIQIKAVLKYGESHDLYFHFMLKVFFFWWLHSDCSIKSHLKDKSNLYNDGRIKYFGVTVKITFQSKTLNMENGSCCSVKNV